jgi:hypothetical protein
MIRRVIRSRLFGMPLFFGQGFMGKAFYIGGICGMLLMVAANTSEAKARNASLARVLPSQVKTITLAYPRPQQSRSRNFKTSLKRPKKIKSKAIPKEEVISPESLDPSTSKYSTRSVFFWHSPYHLPATYHCDEEISETKKRDAQMQALAKCQASGNENCELSEVTIVKNGKLACSDIPGTACQPSHHYAGCVAVAVVLGKR